MITQTVVNIPVAWNVIRLGPLPEFQAAARAIGWSDGSQRPPGLLFDPLKRLIERAKSAGIVVRLWLDGEPVADLRQAYAKQTLVVLGLD